MGSVCSTDAEIEWGTQPPKRRRAPTGTLAPTERLDAYLVMMKDVGAINRRELRDELAAANEVHTSGDEQQHLSRSFTGSTSSQRSTRDVSVDTVPAVHRVCVDGDAAALPLVMPELPGLYADAHCSSSVSCVAARRTSPDGSPRHSTTSAASGRGGKHVEFDLSQNSTIASRAVSPIEPKRLSAALLTQLPPLD